MLGGYSGVSGVVWRLDMVPDGAPSQAMVPRGEQEKGRVWEGAMERGMRQSCPPCPNLLQAGRATGGAGLSMRVDSMEETAY